MFYIVENEERRGRYFYLYIWNKNIIYVECSRKLSVFPYFFYLPKNFFNTVESKTCVWPSYILLGLNIIQIRNPNVYLLICISTNMRTRDFL